MTKLKNGRELQGRVFHKTAGRCYYCGDSLDPFGTWQIDHIIPQIQGGSDDFSNLAPACQPCNSRKGGRTPEQFKEVYRERMRKGVDMTLQAVSFVIPIAPMGGACDRIHLLCREIQEQINELDFEWYYPDLHEFERQQDRDSLGRRAFNSSAEQVN